MLDGGHPEHITAVGYRLRYSDYTLPTTLIISARQPPQVSGLFIKSDILLVAGAYNAMDEKAETVHLQPVAEPAK